MFPPRQVEWAEDALVELEQIATTSPRAAACALSAAEQMGLRGYDEGRPTTEPDIRYRPPIGRDERLGLYYVVTRSAYRIVWVLDARRLSELP